MSWISISVIVISGLALVHGNMLADWAKKLNDEKIREVKVTVNGIQIIADLGVAKLDNTAQPTKITISYTLRERDVTQTIEITENKQALVQPHLKPLEGEPFQTQVKRFWARDDMKTVASGTQSIIWSATVYIPVASTLARTMTS